MGNFNSTLKEVINNSDVPVDTFKKFIKDNPEHTETIKSLSEVDISVTFDQMFRVREENLTSMQTANLLSYYTQNNIKTLEKYVYTFAEPITLLELLRKLRTSSNLNLNETIKKFERTYTGDINEVFRYLLPRYFSLWTKLETTQQLEKYIPDVTSIMLYTKDSSPKYYTQFLDKLNQTLNTITDPGRHQRLFKIQAQLYWDNIRSFVKKTPIKQFVWESVCQKFGISEDDMEMLRKLAVEFDVVPEYVVGRLNKAQLCSAVNSIPNKIIDRESQSCPSEEMDEFTKQMIPVVDPFTLEPIPPYRRIKVGPTCFDVESLHELIRKDQWAVHPMTRQPLPTERINALHTRIQQLGFPRNAYHDIQDTPIMSAEGLLKMRTTNLWNHLINAPPINMFLGASIEQLDRMVRLLGEYGLFTEAEVAAYPQNATTLQKQSFIVKTLEEKRLNINYVSASTLVTVLNDVFTAPVVGGARRFASRRRASKFSRRRKSKSRRRSSRRRKSKKCSWRR